MSVQVKICGLTTQEAVEATEGADYVGFVFYGPSPRNLMPAQAAELASFTTLPACAVTVNPADDFLHTLLNTFKPAYIQLHGDESPERVRHIRETFDIPVIKAIRISSGDDIAKAHAYAAADLLMFDANVPKGMPGGNGLAFDWRMLASRSFAQPWFLSGGLSLDNVEEAVRISSASMVDVSSSLESSPGVKDPNRVREFIKKAKSL